MNNKKLLIFYLTANDRYFIFEKFLEELSKIKNIKDIQLLISTSSDNTTFYCDELKKYNIDYHIEIIKCPANNYLPKVYHALTYALNHNIPYIMKCDNDVLIPSYTIDFMIENAALLDDDSNLTLSPTISTGIPSVEYFIDDFLNESESLKIREEFKKCKFYIQDGIMDYTPLNKYTINNNNEWNYKQYYTFLNNYINNYNNIGNGKTKEGYCVFYKGIHPIRHGFGNETINNLIIKYKNIFFKQKDCSIFIDNNPYLCNMCFMISTQQYNQIMNNENLIIDGCDEVPLNRYKDHYKLNHLIIKNGFTIHITYNWRWFLNNIDGGSNIEKPNISLLNYEQKFINQLYDSN